MEVAAPCEPERMWLGISMDSETQPEGCGYLRRAGTGMTKMEVAAPCEPERMWLGIRTYSETQPEGCGYLNLFQYQYLMRP
jgi:hypothetical protein